MLVWGSGLFEARYDPDTVAIEPPVLAHPLPVIEARQVTTCAVLETFFRALYSWCREENAMVTLTEALAAEQSKRRRDTEDASKRKQVGRALLQALVQCLN